jgi:hypothetical protein
MARIRTIKPEFFTSEDIVSMSPLSRLLYVALWCEADREGRMLWKPRTFKMRYFPGDACDIEAMCAEIVSAGLVKLYGDGMAYVPAFSKHQHINPRESASSLPAPDASRTRRPRVSTGDGTVSDAQGGREGREGKEGDAPSPADGGDDAAVTPVVLIPLNDGSDHVVTEPMVREWSSSFPAVNVPQQLRNMRAWSNAKPSRRKTSRGVNAFIVGWLSKAQDKGGFAAGGGDDPFAGAS